MRTLLFLVAAVQIANILGKSFSEDLLLTVKDINSKYHTKTNVFFDFENNPITLKCVPQLSIPAIIIARPVDIQFISFLHKDIAVIVYVARNSTDIARESLIHVLHRMHQVIVMFVLLESTDPYPVFQWAWKNGFKNTVALFWIRKQKQLAEFQPFPKLTSFNIDRIQDSNLQKPITNFHQHPIRTPIAHDPPRSFRYSNRQGRLVFAGLFVKLFSLFIEHYNATLEECKLPDPYPVGLNHLDYIAAAEDGNFDIGLHPFAPVNDRFLFTDSYWLGMYYLMVPYAQPVSKSLYVVLPFQQWTWAAVALMMSLFAMGIFLATDRVDFGQAMLQALSGILLIPFRLRNKNNSKAWLLIFILLSVSGFMLSNMYLAQLSTFLSTYAYGKQLNTVDDAVSSGLPVTLGEAELKMCKLFGMDKSILDQAHVVSLSTLLRLRRSLNTSIISVVGLDKFSFYSYQQIYLKRPKVKIIDQNVLSVPIGFVMPLTSPYAEMYSEYVRRVVEHGFYRKFEGDLNNDGIASGLIAFIKPESPDVAPLTLQHFVASWILLIVGLGLGLISFVLEVV